MSGSSIGTTINQTVILGSPSYASPLTVTGSGFVYPTLSNPSAVLQGFSGRTLAAFGIISTVASPYLDNLGFILGAPAESFSSTGQTLGGYGAYFASGGTVANGGTISGGAGAEGGVAVYIKGAGTIINSGLISGGYGKYLGNNAVLLSSGSVLNDGVITGGASQEQGGEAVFLSNSRVTNNGTILGGNGGIRGEIGVGLGQNNTLVNNGVIRAGNGGEFGEFAIYAVGKDTNTIINTSLISGEAGLVMGAGSLSNTGEILGTSGRASMSMPTPL